jgi:hypothetical protein
VDEVVAVAELVDQVVAVAELGSSAPWVQNPYLITTRYQCQLI